MQDGNPVETSDATIPVKVEDTQLQVGDETAPKDLSQKVEELARQPYVDISDGLPFADAQEFIDAALPMFLREASRIPIVAVRDKGQLRVFALFGLDHKHETLWNNMEKQWGETIPKPEVAFVTAIEGITPIPQLTEANPPSEFAGPHLKLTGKDHIVYHKLAPGSGFTDRTEPQFKTHPLKGKDLLTSGPQVVRDFFAKLPGTQAVNV